jgi:replication factor A1
MHETMADIDTLAAEIGEQLGDQKTVTTEEIAAKLHTLIEEYHLPLSEARRAVVSAVAPEDAPEAMGRFGGDQSASLDAIERAEEWVDLTVQVLELWDPGSEAIAQVGLLGDETGRMKFVSFTTSELPELVEGRSYRLENVVTDEYEGRFSVKLNRTTTITELDEEVTVGESMETVIGALVDVQRGSGLIRRCDEEGCTRVLQNGTCSEHGEQSGSFDLRIKGVLDDGEAVQELIFDRERTAALSGIDLEAAKEMAQDALDTGVVEREIRERVIGRYIEVRGPELGRYLLVDEFETAPVTPDPEELLIRARAI